MLTYLASLIFFIVINVDELHFIGDVIDIQTGEWISRMSGLGAGIDSFFEYLLKVKHFPKNTVFT